MEIINTIEQKLADWFARAPHLPTNTRRWLADNIWWIMLVIAIISFAGLGILLLAILLGGALATMLAGVVGFALSGVALSAVILGSLPALVVIVFIVMAITPLRARLEKGWRWLFIAALLDICFSLIQLVLSTSERGFIGFILTTLLTLYVLFEIRAYFVSRKAGKAATLTTAAQK